MRPLHLSMTAFGPFAGTETIDFEALGRNPLFLINGPTGAGKTSILDAICFALYGETTGNERQPGDLRSHHAYPATLTEVSLVFELGAACYRIRRVPEQDRPKSRGEGTTVHKAEAQLDRLEAGVAVQNLVPRKTGEANQRVVELTGLSADQFRQVMVLPQGKFRELLLARSEEREAIFQQLFQTQVYTRLERLLRERATQLDTDVKRLRERQNGMLQGTGLDSLDALDEAIGELAAAVESAALTRLAAAQRQERAELSLQQARALAERFAGHDLAQRELAGLESAAGAQATLQALAAAARAASGIKGVFDSLQACEHELTRTAAASVGAQQAVADALSLELEAAERFAAAQARLPELQQLRRQQDWLQGLEPVAQAMQQGAHLLEQRAAALEQCTAELLRVRAERDRALLQGEELQRHISDLRVRIETLDRKPAEHAQWLARRAKQAELEAVAQELAADQRRLERHDLDAAQAQQRLQQSQQLSALLQSAWARGQAAVLARTLQDDTPCPVCGSADHPHPAAAAGEVPEDAAIEQAREAEQQAREEDQRQRLAVGRLQQSVMLAERRLGELRAAVGEDDLGLAQIDAHLAILQAELQTLEQARVALRAAEAERSVGAAALTQLDSALERLRTAYEAASRDETAARGAWLAHGERLPEALRVPGMLDNALRENAAALVEVDSRHERARAAHAVAREQLVAARASLDAARAAAAHALTSRDQSLLRWEQALAQSCFTDTVGYRAALMEADELGTLEAAIRKHQDAVLLAHRAVEERQALLRDALRPELRPLEQEAVAARVALDDAITTLSAQQTRLQALGSIREALRDLVAQQQVLESEYGSVGRLSRVANGGNGFNLSLQRFVLSVLLDDVLVEAGQRLALMSRGRYQLLRRDEVTDRRSKAGLELDVEDAYTGRVRPVATLSGGESFMASLALALGLSDVVQAYSGGIRLDTLFIDEGFGSLDAEALELAIRTLVDLQASGRMVGIISHVPELKAQISVQLLVEPTASGSRLCQRTN